MSSFANVWLVAYIFGFALFIFHLQLNTPNSEICTTKFDSKPLHFFLTFCLGGQVIWNLGKARPPTHPLEAGSNRLDLVHLVSKLGLVKSVSESVLFNWPSSEFCKFVLLCTFVRYEGVCSPRVNDIWIQFLKKGLVHSSFTLSSQLSSVFELLLYDKHWKD